MSHTVDRLEIELAIGGDAATARDLSDRVSVMRTSALAPLLTRVCDELGPSQVPLRIDRLAIDLGRLTADDFEVDFVQRLEPALRAALADAIGPVARTRDPLHDALETVEVFACSGNLPWWEDVADPRAVERALVHAAANAPGDLLALVARLAPREEAITRLAAHFDDEALDALAPHLGLEVARSLSRAARALAHALLVSSRAPTDASPGATAPAPITSAASGRLSPSAARRHVRASLIAALARAPWQTSDDAIDALLHALADRLPAVLVSLAVDPEVDLPAPVRTLLARWRDVSPPAPAALPPSRKVVAGAEPRAPHLDDAQTAARTLADPAPVARRPAAHGRPPHAGDASMVRAGLERGPDATPSPAHLGQKRALAQLDAVYVPDAGLALLWPFYRRFFERLDLLDPSGATFANAEAPSTGARALAYLATRDPEPAEFHLGLAKLLAGLALDTMVDCTEPLDPKIAIECEQLIDAVLAQVQALFEIDAEPFRRTFLSRPGVIETRDGAWFLQVERREEDVLLQRLAWSWSWVKLPWMPHPMRVAW